MTLPAVVTRAEHGSCVVIVRADGTARGRCLRCSATWTGSEPSDHERGWWWLYDHPLRHGYTPPSGPDVTRAPDAPPNPTLGPEYFPDSD